MGKPSGSRKKQAYDKKTTDYKLLQRLKNLYITSVARESILQLLFYHPLGEFALSEIAGEAGVSKSTASTLIRDLQGEGLVTIVQLPVVWRIRANYNHPTFKREKVLYNLSIIYRSGLVDFLGDLLKNPKNIILFGSFSKGEDTLNSDIDIAIEDESVEETTVNSIPELERMESQLGRKISIHLFNRDTVDINLFNNIANGYILSGFLEVGKWIKR